MASASLITVPVTPAATPAWLPKVVALLVALTGPCLAILDPGNKIPTGAATAVVMLGFLVVAAVIFTVHLVGENGLSRAGLERTVSEEEAWFKQNYSEIRSTFEAAKPALDQIPGMPAAMASVQSELADVRAKVSAPQDEAIEAAVRGLLPKLVVPVALKDAEPAGPAATVAPVAPAGPVATVAPVAPPAPAPMAPAPVAQAAPAPVAPPAVPVPAPGSEAPAVAPPAVRIN